MRLVMLAGQIVMLVMAWPVDAAPRQSAANGAGGTVLDCRASEVEAAPFIPPTSDTSAGGRNTADVVAREQFLAGDVLRALDTWNRIGQPRVQCVNVEGLVRTRRSAIVGYLDVAAGEVFTPEKFARIQRRLDELSVASRTRLRYDPVAGGSTTITPILAERDVMPYGLQGWGLLGARAVALQEVRVAIVSPAGRGEVWSPSYRWSGDRPRAMVRLDAPAPGRLPGILRLQVFLESQAYRYPVLADEIFRQPRQRVGAALSDWVTSWLRWEGGTAYDRIETIPYLALEGSLNARALGDRLAVIVTAGRWTGVGDHASFASGELVATVRSTTRQDVPLFTALVGTAATADSAPLAIWPATSSGEGRNGLLRAHPLRRSSIITGEVFGRQLIFTTTEYEYPFQTRVGPVSVAGFIDAARASRRRVFNTSSPFHVDVGAGVRFAASGTGKVRLDVGYGLRDGRVSLSAGYVTPWGRR